MSKINYDGVLEAAHFISDGQLDWVRVYLRRYSIFTDRIILSRQEFVNQLKAGRRFMVGERILNMGGKFSVTQPVHVSKNDSNMVISVGDGQPTQDDLSGVPVI